jgi:hypothetical protein
MRIGVGGQAPSAAAVHMRMSPVPVLSCEARRLHAGALLDTALTLLHGNKMYSARYVMLTIRNVQCKTC